MGLGVFNIDFGVEFKLDVIGGLLGFGVAGEGEACGLEVNVDFGDIGGGNCEVDDVLFGVAGG